MEETNEYLKDCLKCQICWEIIDSKDNKTCNLCGVTYCTKCITPHLEKSSDCPNCRKSINIHHMTKSISLNNVIDEIVNPKNKTDKLKWGIHNSQALLYCQTCEQCMCLDCVWDKTHNDHDYTKIEVLFRTQKEKAKYKFEEVNNTISDLTNMQNLVDTINTNTKKIVWAAKKDIEKSLNKIAREYIDSNYRIIDKVNQAISKYSTKLDNSIKSFTQLGKSNDFNRYFELVDMWDKITEELDQKGDVFKLVDQVIYGDTFWGRDDNSNKFTFSITVRMLLRMELDLYEFTYQDKVFTISAVYTHKKENQNKIFNIYIENKSDQPTNFEFDFKLLTDFYHQVNFVSSWNFLKFDPSEKKILGELELSPSIYINGDKNLLQFQFEIIVKKASDEFKKYMLKQQFLSKLNEIYE